MKKYIVLLLSLVMLLLTACGTGSTKTTIDNTTDIDTAETTGDISSTGTTDATTGSTENTQGSTEGTTKPTQGSTVPEDYILKISRSELSLLVGEIGNLTVTNTGPGTLSWTSSNTSVATVSNGKVTAKAAGVAVITVSDGIKSSQCVVTVTKKDSGSQPVDYTLNLSKSSLDLKVGNSSTLSVTYTGSKSLTWTSSKTSVATVSNGKVTAKAVGTAIITVSDGVKSAQCIVNVTDVTLTVTPTSLSLSVGATSTLTATYDGSGSLSWSSSNTSVATVDRSGKVTALAAGKSNITVSDGTKTATCAVTVSAPANKTLTINTPAGTKVLVGGTLQIDYDYSGNASELTWESTDTSVLTVDQNGKVTGKKAGGAGISVTNGQLTRRVRIVVEAPAASTTTSIEVGSMNAPLYEGQTVNKFAGDYMNLMAYTLPTDSNRNVTVTSSNNNVVSVSWSKDSSNKNNITLNFKSAGSATVTITSGDGAVSKSYSINVKSGYACNPGSGQLTPEQWADCCTQVMVENGFKKNTSCGSYRVLTLSANDLTFAVAKDIGQAKVHEWYPNGCRSCWISYEGTNEDGDYVFYTRWG